MPLRAEATMSTPSHAPHHDGGPVARALAGAAHVLPDQGPIGVFIHHNTLHAFQHLPFREAVTAGAAAVAAEPFPAEGFLRDAWQRGRIEDVDVEAALAEDAGTTDDALPLGLTVRRLRLALLRDDIDVDDAAGVRWQKAHGLLHDARDEARWLACLAAAERQPATTMMTVGPPPRRHRDVLVALGHDDVDALLHWELQRVAASFLDQGQALSPLPGREAGFLKAVAGLFAAGAREPRFAPGAAAAFARIAADDTGAEAVIATTLTALGVGDDDVEDYVTATLLALPGWAGMFNRLERHPDELLHTPLPVRLADFLAVRLVYQRAAVERACAAAGLPVAWSALKALAPSRTMNRDPILDARLLCGLVDAANACAADVAALTDDDVAALLRAARAFPSLTRRWVLLLAYEGRYRRQILDAVAARRALGAPTTMTRPSAQFVFCIDEREESIRRALEEQDPTCETFGAAGFFGMAIDYKGLDDDQPAAYCPVVVTPAHEVHETPVEDERDHHEARARRRSLWQRLQRLLAATSRSVVGGAALSILGGPLAGAAIVSRVVAPRESLAARARIGQGLLRPPTTRLQSTRADDADDATARTERGRLRGFTLAEAADRVTALLKNIGLARAERFAPIVVVLGHGSTSLNNPHESAHDCGACGGRRGGANARLFAALANHPEVREAVRARGVAIPDGTWFVGGLHDTANDDVLCADLDDIPATTRSAWEQAAHLLERARRDSAKERTRRFDDAPLDLTPDEALRHVQARASHLAQPRPEYGHCTNAIAVVGRRGLTRGLHLDRRPFLVSYDPTIDEADVLLERILAAVGPVGAGINLEYYFSSVDNERFGCGTKLPHNVTGLIGVMNGHGGDLRTGLPWQMVELHEPMRLLLIVEATPEALLGVAGRQAEVRELVVNGWVQLVSLHPQNGALQVFSNGAFVPYTPSPVTLPRVRRSLEHHGRHREHLPPALVEAALVDVAPEVSHA